MSKHVWGMAEERKAMGHKGLYVLARWMKGSRDLPPVGSNTFGRGTGRASAAGLALPNVLERSGGGSLVGYRRIQRPWRRPKFTSQPPRYAHTCSTLRGGNEQVWVDGREWAILAAPAILAHFWDEQVCEREWPESVRHWGIDGYGVFIAGVAAPAPRSQKAAASGSPDRDEPH